MQSRFCFLLIISSPNCRFKCKAREAKVGLNSTGLDYWTGRPDFSNVNLCYINCELLQMIQLPKKYDKNFILTSRQGHFSYFIQVVSTRLIQVVRNRSCYELVVINVLTTELVTWRRYQTCWKNLLQVCWPHRSCYKIITTCYRLINNCSS